MVLHILQVDLGRDPVTACRRACALPRLRCRAAARAACCFAPALSSELADADLGDAHLTQRTGLLTDRPAESFPKALRDAELEAAYRFFGNGKVTPQAILAPDVRQTVLRALVIRYA